MPRMNVLILTLLLPASLAVGAESAPLFQSTDTLDITLTGPFRQIDRARDREEEYDGSLSYVAADGQAVELEATFEVRGNFRLQRDVCRYSQLWVDLRRGEVPGTVFEGQNRLKLVVQCQPQDRYADLVVKEFLAYILFNRLTEPGFDVRLVNVTYNDSEREDETRTHLGVFIEHRDTVAERFEFEGVDENSIDLADLNPRQATLVALFMMMIGNTDFSLRSGPEGDECCHNAKLLRTEGGYFPIPYDFDASGFVDASYAADPNPAFGIRNNRQRLFRGYCLHNDSVAPLVPLFQAARSDILALAGDARLTEREAEDTRKYLEDFYAILDDPDEIEDEILDDCRE